MWPSVPVPNRSPWAAQARALAPRGYTASAASRPPRSAQAGPVTAVRGSITGCAVLFDTWMSPRTKPLAGHVAALPKCARVRFAAGAFDRWIRRMKRGRADAVLCFDHKLDTASASTADGSLRVFVADGGLRFSVRPGTASGRVALAAARGLAGHRQASVYANSVQGHRTESDGVALFVVTEAELVEISLVPRGACPGTWVLVN